MLLDTSGLMCLFDRSDIRHIKALNHFDSATHRLTHNYVIAEFVALAIARRAPLPGALRFINAIHNSDEIEVVWVDEGLHKDAMSLLAKREDKRWSLCDAVSFVLMNSKKVEGALTTDHNFDQAGLIRLLDQ